MSVLSRLADAVLGERVPDEELPHPVPPGVTVRRNRLIPALGGAFMGKGRGGARRTAAAVTLRKTILLNARMERIAPDLIVHELVHVEQWSRDRLFPVKYVAAWVRHGFSYDRIPYEIEAYERQERFAAESPPRRARQP